MKPPYPLRKVYCLALVFLGAAVLPATASTFTWTGGGANANFTTAANWGGTAPAPGTTSDYVFAGTTNLSPQVTTGNWSASSITFNSTAGTFNILGSGDATADRFTMTTSAYIEQDSASNETISAFVITNGGTLTIQGSGTGTLALAGISDSTGSGTVAITRNLTFGTYRNASTPHSTFALQVYPGVTLTFSGATSEYLGTSPSQYDLPYIKINVDGSGNGGAAATVQATNPGGFSSASQVQSNDAIFGGSVAMTFSGLYTLLGTGNETLSFNDTGGTTLSGSTIQFGAVDGSSSRTVTLSVGSSATAKLSGAISGSASTGTTSITKSGGGTLTLSGVNTYNGVLTLGGGILNAATTNINGSSTTNGIVFNGGTLQAATGGISTAKAVTMTGAGTFDTNGNNSTLSGNISGSGGALSKAGTGTLVLSGSGNTFSAGLTLTNGTVQDGNSNSGVLGSGIVTLGTSNTPTLDLNGNSASVGLLVGASTNGIITNNLASSSSTLTLNGTGTQTFAGVIQNGGTGKNVALDLSGGTQILSGSNTYTGGTTVGGTSTLLANNNSGSAVGTGSLTVNSGATIGGAGKFVLTAGAFTINGKVQVGNGADAVSQTTLSSTSASSFNGATLTFNLNTAYTGANSSSNILNVGATGISFTDTTLQLNLIGDNLIEANTPYTLISGTSGVSYGSLNTFTNSLGQLQIEDSNLTLSFANATEGTFYAPSYLFISGNNIDVEVVPEPGTWAMMLGGLATLFLIQSRRRRLR